MQYSRIAKGDQDRHSLDSGADAKQDEQSPPSAAPLADGDLDERLDPSLARQLWMFGQEGLGNGVFRERLSGTGSSTSSGGVPHQALMERAFGEDLSGLEVDLGAGEALSDLHADAAADGDRLMFRSLDPTPLQVAEEVAHALQARRAGPESAQGISSPTDASEREAKGAAQRVVAGQTAEVKTRPAAPIQRDESPGADGSNSGTEQQQEALAQGVEELRVAMAFLDVAKALEIVGSFSLPQRKALAEAIFGNERWRLVSYFTNNGTDEQSVQAQSLMWPVLSVVDRLKLNKGLFNDNEDGMMAALKSASAEELAEAMQDPEINALLEDLTPGQRYEIRVLASPDQWLHHMGALIREAKGMLSDDEDVVVTWLLQRSPGDRKLVWDTYEDAIKELGVEEAANIKKMCVSEDGMSPATEADALTAGMVFATDGLGTEDELLTLLLSRANSLAQEEQQAQALLQSGIKADGTALSEEERATLEKRLEELGGVQQMLSPSQRNVDGSFLSNLDGDVMDGQYQESFAAINTDAFEVAKQRILEATELWDDEEAVYAAIDALHAPIELPKDRKLSKDEILELQDEADKVLRRRLLEDEEIHDALKSMLEEHAEVLNGYLDADSYVISIHKLLAAVDQMGTNEQGLFQAASQMRPDDRAELLNHPERDEYQRLFTGIELTEGEKALLRTILETGRMPLDGGLELGCQEQDKAILTDVFASMTEPERMQARRGYWISRGGLTGPLSAEDQSALMAFKRIETMLWVYYPDQEDLQGLLDQALGLPTKDELSSNDGLRMAVDIMRFRHAEKLKLSGAGEALTLTDETAEQAAAIFEANYQQAIDDGLVTMDEFMALAALDQDFNSAFQDQAQAMEGIWKMAATIAATAAALVVIAASGGTLTGPVLAMAAAYGAPTALISAELAGGDFFDAAGSEGAITMVSGSVDAALTALSFGLLKNPFGWVGLTQNGLKAEISLSAMSSTRSVMANYGKRFGLGVLEGVVDGTVGGAASELVFTMADAETWRRGAWAAICALGGALVRGAGMGALAGGLAAGTLSVFEGLVSLARLPSLEAALVKAGIPKAAIGDLTEPQAKALAALDKAIASGDQGAVDAALRDMRTFFPEDQIDSLYRELKASKAPQPEIDGGGGTTGESALGGGLIPEQTLAALNAKLGPDGVEALARGLDAEALARVVQEIDPDTLASLVNKGLDGHTIGELASGMSAAELKALAKSASADELTQKASLLAKERLSLKADALRQNYLGGRPAPSKGNAAAAELRLDDGTLLTSEATSKKAPMDMPRPLSEGPDPITGKGGHFEPGKHADEQWIRETDSEYKILSDLADQLTEKKVTDPHGLLRLYTERTPCDSCNKIIYEQFNSKYPKIQIDVTADFTVNGDPL